MAQIQVPADGELLRDDFVLSGMVFDDDGVQAVWYRIDNGEFQRLAGGNNFSVPLSIAEVSDNEHVVEVKAEDLGGVTSAVAKARFKVSRSDPVSSLVSPRISDHLRDIVDLKGTSRDPNGIAEVRISFDNGLSFNRVQGTETWQYRLDTRLLADGTQAVLVNAVDATGAEGLYTTTINIDNHAPELVVDSPADGEVFGDRLRLDGSTRDTIGVSSLAVSITPMAGTTGTAKPVEVALTRAGIVAQDVDIKGLADRLVQPADRDGRPGGQQELRVAQLRETSGRGGARGDPLSRRRRAPRRPLRGEREGPDPGTDGREERGGHGRREAHRHDAAGRPGLLQPRGEAAGPPAR